MDRLRNGTIASSSATLVVSAGAIAVFWCGYQLGQHHRNRRSKKEYRSRCEEGKNDADDVLSKIEVKKQQNHESSSQMTVTNSSEDFSSTNALIDEVLSYWFAKYDSIPTLQSRLWMIPSQHADFRRATDLEIWLKFRHLVLLDPLETTTTPRGKLARIIVLDQFTRHLHRLADNNIGGNIAPSSLQSLTQSLRPQATYDQMAFQVARSLWQSHDESSSPISGSEFTIPMLIFALLPYRHQNTIETVSFVQDQIKKLDQNLVPEYDRMIRRFRSATNRRMDGLWQQLAQATKPKQNGPYDNTNKDNNILEHEPFPADRTTAPQHIVYRTIQAFLLEQPPFDTLLVSLSGGVDSMVIASVVADLMQTNTDTSATAAASATTTTTRFRAVHIDYNNRAESGQEAAFVEQYCRETLHIPCHVRRIEEFTRGVTKRDEYERQSREIRYDAYKAAICGTKNNLPIVLLGHHKGDLRENVLSNVHKGCTVLELSGMTKVSKQQGVTLWRPLLPLEKNLIFDYAHTYGVPYFKDTTPHWSTRGKLRNKLIPLLQDVYGEGSMEHLSQLAVESDACRELVFSTVLQPFLDQVESYTLGISFATTPWRNYGLFFWKVVLRQTLHSVGLGMFSDKMVVSFMERACDAKKSIREGWLQCRRDYAVYLQHDGRVFVFYPSSFPWNKNDQYVLPEETVGFNDEIRVGSWNIVATKISETLYEQQLLHSKAIPSFQHFMNGKIEYYLVVQERAGDSKPLRFCKVSKDNRPDAWKTTDLRIQSTLPLLLPDVSQIVVDKEPSSLVKVSMTVVTTS